MYREVSRPTLLMEHDIKTELAQASMPLHSDRLTRRFIALRKTSPKLLVKRFARSNDAEAKQAPHKRDVSRWHRGAEVRPIVRRQSAVCASLRVSPPYLVPHWMPLAAGNNVVFSPATDLWLWMSESTRTNCSLLSALMRTRAC